MSFHVGVYRVVSCRVVGKCNFYLSTLFILPFPRHKISLSTIIFHRCEFISFPQTLLLLSFCCPVHVLSREHICRLNGLLFSIGLVGGCWLCGWGQEVEVRRLVRMFVPFLLLYVCIDNVLGGHWINIYLCICQQSTTHSKDDENNNRKSCSSARHNHKRANICSAQDNVVAD